jgi:hypothetical protein
MTVFLRGNRPPHSSQQRPYRSGRSVGGGGIGSGLGGVANNKKWMYGVALLLLMVVVLVLVPSSSSKSSSSSSTKTTTVGGGGSSDTSTTTSQKPGQLRRRKGTLLATEPTIVPPLSPARVPDTNVFYLLPPETKAIQGILFFFHGCQHTGGADFFLLPEDRIVAYEAVHRHSLIAVGLTSSDRISGCWGNVDVPLIQQDMEKFLTHVQEQIITSTRTIQQQHDHTLAQLPKYGMGASSGAEFMLKHATLFQFTRVAAYIPPRGALDQISKANLPPLILVHMPRDAHNADVIKEWVKGNQKDTTSEELQVLTVEPHVFTTERCHERIPEIPKETCSTLIERALSSVKDPIMNEQGYVVKSYVVTDAWSKVMSTLDLDQEDSSSSSSSSSSKVPSEVPIKSFSGHSWKWAAVQEEVQVAFGRHEMTAEHSTQVLNFLQGHVQ